MDLPVFDPELIGAYASNALFITGSALSSPVGLIADLVAAASSLLP
ncbi:MAG TPA: hypothetical protein H9870_04965 [Candidatus Corynebacterium avicola]|uniref:Uncharacterized protein n=1 Tax=Candidatus Corynebacterium avicola TaxID=2838527 RepID=A0A9D1RQK6_9CORY|nr:hypothetical protein [Candidatus Corynebacterium avicola]